MAAVIIGIGIAAAVIFCKEKKINMVDAMALILELAMFIYMLFHMEYAPVILILILFVYGAWRFAAWARKPLNFRK